MDMNQLFLLPIKRETSVGFTNAGTAPGLALIATSFSTLGIAPSCFGVDDSQGN